MGWCRLQGKKIDTRFNISPNFNYNQSADILNSVKTTSKTTSTGLGLYISKAKDKKYDISISNNYSYNNTKSSQNGKSDYSTNSLGFDGTIYYKKFGRLIQVIALMPVKRSTRLIKT